jgi:YD repeat-containing protein
LPQKKRDIDSTHRFQYQKLEPRQLLATVTWDGDAGNGNWQDATNWSEDTLPTAVDDVVISEEFSVGNLAVGTTTINSLDVAGRLVVDRATLAVNGDSTVADLEISNSGGVQGAGDIAISESLYWWGNGTIQGEGDLIIESGAQLRINTFTVLGTSPRLSKDVANHGTAELLTTLPLAAAAFENFGTFRADGETYITSSSTSTDTRFTNFGTILKTGTDRLWFSRGTNTNYLGFDNHGTFDIRDGLVVLNTAGTHDGEFNVQAGELNLQYFHTFTDSSDVFGDGLLTFAVQNASFDGRIGVREIIVDRIGGNVEFNAPVSLRTVQLLSGSLGGDADITVADRFDWAGGSALTGSGQLIIESDATLDIRDGSSNTHFLTKQINNFGTTELRSSLTFSGGVFNNDGSFIATPETSLIDSNSTSDTNVFNNRGTFIKEGSQTLSIYNQSRFLTFNNTGIVDVQDGILSMRTWGFFNDPVAIRVSPFAQVHNEYFGRFFSAQSPEVFDPEGIVLFSKSRELEVLSEDLGATQAGFDDNFAFGNLTFGTDNSGSHMTLTDAIDNASGDTAEAIYVDNLNVRYNSSINLNGLNLYARSAKIDGSISGGTVTIVPDGGEILLGKATSGDISTANEIDNWTFFGRAGSPLNINLNPGVGEPPTPLNAPLNWGEVRVFDPTGTLIASANNDGTGIGTAIQILGLSLSVTGTYSVEVSAPASQSTSTGQYVLTVDNTIVDSNLLLFNERNTGVIETTEAIDQWQFSAFANTQVQLELLQRSTENLAFTLIGPNGNALFTDAVDDPGLVNLPDSGEYVLTARGLRASTGNYAFRMTQTTQLALPLDQEISGVLPGNRSAVVYKIDAPGDTPLLLDFDLADDDLRTEVYVRRSAPPTRGLYDYRYTSPNSADHEILVPNASEGEWFVLVYGDYVPTETSYALRVDTTDVQISSVSPAQQNVNTVASITIQGAGFLPGTTVRLRSPLGAITASTVEFDSFSQIHAEFDLTDVSLGFYEVQLISDLGGVASLPTAFRVTPEGQSKFEARIIAPENLGRTTGETFYVEYENAGDAPIAAPLLSLKSADPDGSDKPILTLDESLRLQSTWRWDGSSLPPGTGHSVLILASGQSGGVLNPGEKFRVPVYYVGQLSPFDNTDLGVELELRSWSVTDTDEMNWSELSGSLKPESISSKQWRAIYTGIQRGIGTTGDYVRMLNENASYLSRLGKRVTSVSDIWRFRMLQADGLGIASTLESVEDIRSEVPGDIELTISRSFSSSILGRNGTGSFGQGWLFGWDTELVREPGIAKVVSGDGSARTYVRSRQGNFGQNDSYFSPRGDSSTITRNIVNNRLEWGAGDTTRVQFRDDGKMLAMLDWHGNSVTATYDSNDRLVQLTHSNGYFIRLIRGPNGNIISAEDSEQLVTTYEYDDSGEYLTRVISDDGQVTDYSYETSDDYQIQNALKSVTRDAVTRRFEYFGDGRIRSIEAGEDTDQLNIDFESAGKVSISNGTSTSEFYFNDRGALSKSVDPYGRTSTTKYNSAGFATEKVHPDGTTIRYNYDEDFNLTEVTNELGHSTKYEYEYGVINGIVGILPNPTPRISRIVDAAGNSTQLNYLDLSRKNTLTEVVLADGSREQFGDHINGLPQEIINRRGQTLRVTYDAAGRVSSQTFADGRRVTIHYDQNGNLKQVSDGNQTADYFYELPGKPRSLTRVAYSNGRELSYEYDGFNRRIKTEDHTGNITHYSYDSSGRVFELKDANNALIIRYGYNENGRVSREDKANGTFSTYTYNLAGQLESVVNHKTASEVSSQFSYSYDSRGRQTREDSLDGVWEYSYDSASQLKLAIFTPVENGLVPAQRLEYFYDSVGNRTRTLENGVETDYVVNSLNQYTSVGGVDFVYDADGNLIFDGESTFEYNQQGQLTNVLSNGVELSYTYDLLGYRSSESNGLVTTDFIFDSLSSGKIVGQYSGTTGTSTNSMRWNHTSRHGIAGETRDNSLIRTYEQDGYGSVVSKRNAQLEITNQYRYDPTGRITHSNELEDNRFQYGGGSSLTSDESGFIHDAHDSFLPELSDANPSLIGNQDSSSLRPLVVPAYFQKHLDTTGFWDASTGIIDFIDKGINLVQKVYSFGKSPKNLKSPKKFLFKLAIKTALKGTPLQVPACYAFKISSNSALFASRFPTPAGAVAGGLVGLIDSYLSCHLPEQPEAPSGDGEGSVEANSNSEIRTSVDPNDKLGPDGYGEANFVSNTGEIPYKIRFENVGEGSINLDTDEPYDPEFWASAPAQRVTITDQLSPDLDWSTLRIQEFGFGNVVVSVPENTSYFQDTISVEIDGKSFDVDIFAGVDLSSGILYASFQSIDPATKLPPDVLTGFLLPEEGNGEGQGYFSFTIRPVDGLVSGTEIRNIASISFDNQTIIDTNQVSPFEPELGTDEDKEALITIDSAAPTSSVSVLPPESNEAEFSVTWSGSDEANGSGVVAYDVFFSTNGGPFELWLDDTTETSALFAGSDATTYGFYSVAVDGVGHEEEPPATADATTTVNVIEPMVTSVVIGDGTAQRARIETLQVTFNELVDFQNDDPLSAFNLLRVEDVCIVGLVVDSIDESNGFTIVNLSFDGSMTRGGGALVDGNYQLDVMGSAYTYRDSLIAGADFSIGDNSDGDDKFYSLYGDFNGDRTVNVIDLLQFRQSYLDPMTYDRAIDFNGDGVINVFDLLQFRTRYRSSI